MYMYMSGERLSSKLIYVVLVLECVLVEKSLAHSVNSAIKGKWFYHVFHQVLC